MKFAAQVLSVAALLAALCSAARSEQATLSASPDTSLDAARALDTDKSGKVELAEVESFAKMHGLDVDAVKAEFGSFDHDKDGSLDVSELDATLAGQATDGTPKVNTGAAVAPVPASPVSLQSGAAGSTAGGAAEAPPQGTVENMIKALDADGSGKVEETEVEEFAKSQGLGAEQTKEEFRDLDKNGDGELDPTEIKSTVASEDAPAKEAVETKAAPAPAAPVPVPKKETESAAPPALAPVKQAVKEETPAADIAPVKQKVQEDPTLNLKKILSANMVQADQSVARLFASKAASDLSSRNKDVEEAQGLEKVAFKLRAKAAKVAAGAVSSAEAAAQEAGRGIIQAALGQAEKLQSQAKDIEAKAAAISTKAKTAMAAAMNAQQSASKEVDKLVQLEASDAAGVAAAAVQKTVKVSL